MNYPRHTTLVSALVIGCISSNAIASMPDGFEIRKIDYSDSRDRFRVIGDYPIRGTEITIANAGSGDLIAVVKVNRRERFRLVQNEPEVVPCSVRISIDDASVVEDVENAPENCDDGGQTGGGGGPGGGTPPAGDIAVLAANDLGMHCADLDYQIFSILPPFNVVHAQAILKGRQPVLLDNNSVSMSYSAVSSASDPAGVGSINTTNDENSTGHFKTNFWDDSGTQIPLSGNPDNQTFGGAGYGVLYPSVLAGALLDPPVDLSQECDDPQTPAGCPSILNVFEPMDTDSGLPVPDLNELAHGTLKVTRQHMPGPSNTPQPIEKFDSSVPFFANMPFGHTVEQANWWSAEGIPILPVDDNGNLNAYPLMRVSARSLDTDTELAALDIVLPVSSESDCQSCHADPFDCGNPGLPLAIQLKSCNGAGLQSMTEEQIAVLDEAPGETPEQQLLNAAKINILRLHDQKHGPAYTAADGSARACDPLNDPGQHCLDSRRQVQCSQCHYSPALDLAQVGPVDEPEQGPNGRQQTRHVSMSNAMHRHHGLLPDFEGENLFPEMPPAEGRDPVLAGQILEQSCYQCHPGKTTECLRGAMATAGVVCQDCHGDMEQVGNDFSIRVASHNPGDFVMDGSLRVPWASEPGCQSCHTGDAVNKNHPADAVVAEDGIRLLEAYVNETISVPGVSNPVKVAAIHKAPQSRFAENTGSNADGDQVDVLYRLSKGHGGVMCEGCHNSTHAIWPIQNPFANDNIASEQLQGHHGTLTECTTCHTGFDIDDFKDNLDAGLMRGPHGMHPVASSMWNEKHKEVYEDDNTPNGTCESCHGIDGNGTALSRTATTRSFECKNEDGFLCGGGVKTIQVAKGTPIGCGECHENVIGK